MYSRSRQASSLTFSKKEQTQKTMFESEDGVDKLKLVGAMTLSSLHATCKIALLLNF
jgi:hypothetical protein